MGTGRSWKPHKWKEHNFLHRKYTPNIFSTPKKSQHFSIEKKNREKSDKKSKKYIFEKIIFFENLKILIFGLIFAIFFRRKNRGEIDRHFFSELRKIVGYNFDVKLSDLSIYDVFRAFGARQNMLRSSQEICLIFSSHFP